MVRGGLLPASWKSRAGLGGPHSPPLLLRHEARLLALLLTLSLSSSIGGFVAVLLRGKSDMCARGGLSLKEKY